MNWKQFEFIDCKHNQKTDEKYCQQYLKPAYYLDVYLRWTDVESIQTFYQSVVAKEGDLFNYHLSHQKDKETKFSDREKTLAEFPEFLNSKTDHQHIHLTNNGGVGDGEEIGGVSDASFVAWVHRATPAADDKMLKQYLRILESMEADMLGNGVPISYLKVLFPVDTFASPAEFKNWILDCDLIKQGEFFSATAGYKLNFWEGYDSAAATEKRDQILAEYPGFEFDIAIGNSMGRFLNDTKTDILPVIKRVNWLNFVSEAGVGYLGGYDSLDEKVKETDICTLSRLEKGVCIQSSDEPALAVGDENLKGYFASNEILKNLLFKEHKSDYYLDQPNLKDWMFYFNK